MPSTNVVNRQGTYKGGKVGDLSTRVVLRVWSSSGTLSDELSLAGTTVLLLLRMRLCLGQEPSCGTGPTK